MGAKRTIGLTRVEANVELKKKLASQFPLKIVAVISFVCCSPSGLAGGSDLLELALDRLLVSAPAPSEPSSQAPPSGPAPSEDPFP